MDIGERIHNGVLEDEIIEIDVKNGKEITQLKLRKVTFYDRASKRENWIFDQFVWYAGRSSSGTLQNKMSDWVIVQTAETKFSLKIFFGGQWKCH